MALSHEYKDVFWGGQNSEQLLQKTFCFAHQQTT